MCGVEGKAAGSKVGTTSQLFDDGVVSTVPASAVAGAPAGGATATAGPASPVDGGWVAPQAASAIAGAASSARAAARPRRLLNPRIVYPPRIMAQWRQVPFLEQP
jgi:hypothetical protein